MTCIPPLPQDQVFPDPIVFEPTEQHMHTIILLHGRGSNGQEFADELFESQDESGATLPELLPHYRWVFPSAQTFYSHTFQQDMSQWYDVGTLSDPAIRFQPELNRMRESITYVSGIVDRERARAPLGKVVFGGISQGFSLAVVAALMDVSPFEALVGFSSWLPFEPDLSVIISHKTGQNEDSSLRLCISHIIESILGMGDDVGHEYLSLPVFLAHCIDDDLVDVALGRKLSDVLGRLGHDCVYREYEDGGHWVNEPTGVDDLMKFLKEKCPWNS